jgi:hypothetical protein
MRNWFPKPNSQTPKDVLVGKISEDEGGLLRGEGPNDEDN